MSRPSHPRRGVAVVTPLLVAASLASLASIAAPAAAAEPGSRKDEVGDLLVCDCVVMKTRRMGRNPPVLTRTPAFRTTVRECRKRGGRWVLYSAGDRQAALGIWLPDAEGGDPEAQYAVGEIHERGLGGPPDYAEAARWYRAAAEQGLRSAQNSLGQLYERGLGVEADPRESVAWYRRTSGLPDAIALAAPAASGAGSPPPAGTEGPTIVVVVPPLIGAAEWPAPDAVVGRVTAPAGLAAFLAGDRQTVVDARGVFRIPAADAGRESMRLLAEDRLGNRSAVDLGASLDGGDAPGSLAGSDLPFGRFAAVVVGNSGYAHWPPAPAAQDGARALASLLETRYGFEVRLLIDAGRVDVIRALHEIGTKLKEQDNLLVYFSGRGMTEEVWEDGYWLPVDAAPDDRDSWVPISEIIARANVTAARKTLVIADSELGPRRTPSAIPCLDAAASPEVRARQLREAAGDRSLVALAAGAAQEPDPLFARALTEVLRVNDDVLETRRLRAEVAARMALAAPPEDGFQEPAVATLRGHEGGDFLFVPR
jgi:hypothetical protein